MRQPSDLLRGRNHDDASTTAMAQTLAFQSQLLALNIALEGAVDTGESQDWVPPTWNLVRESQRATPDRPDTRSTPHRLIQQAACSEYLLWNASLTEAVQRGIHPGGTGPATLNRWLSHLPQEELCADSLLAALQDADYRFHDISERILGGIARPAETSETPCLLRALSQCMQELLSLLDQLGSRP